MTLVTLAVVFSAVTKLEHQFPPRSAFNFKLILGGTKIFLNFLFIFFPNSPSFFLRTENVMGNDSFYRHKNSFSP